MTEAKSGPKSRQRFECCFCADQAGAPSDPHLELRLTRTFGGGAIRQWLGAHERCLRQALPALTLGSVEVPERSCPVCRADAGRVGNLRIVVETDRVDGGGGGGGAFYIHDACLIEHLARTNIIEV